jgi:hypothetical protein
MRPFDDALRLRITRLAETTFAPGRRQMLHPVADACPKCKEVPQAVARAKQSANVGVTSGG